MTVMSFREPLWTGAEAAAASGGRAVGGVAWSASGVSIDTRTLQQGDLFIALRGETTDGHAFVRTAFEKGAAAAVVSDPGLGDGGPLLLVDDTLRALQGLGRAGRMRSQARIASITGSVGKTSTKEALRHVLAAQGKTHAAAASYNNHIGVPLTLARLPADAVYAVCEVGTNHPGEIEPLARQVRAHVAIITAIASVHLEYFGSVEAIVEEKARIFAAMEGDRTAVLPRDSSHFFRLSELATAAGVSRQVAFGEHVDAQFRLLGCDLDDSGSSVRALAQGREVRYRLGAPGRHWVLNSLAVLAGAAVGADIDATRAAFAGVAAPAGRGARRHVALDGGSVELIDESYNASPPSVRAMLALLAAARPGPAGRRVLVLGDMLELGPDSEALHAALAADVEASGADLVFTAGTRMAALHRALPAPLRAAHAPDSSRLAQRVVEALRAGDVVAVKGSLGSKMKVIVEAIVALGEARAKSGAGRG